METNDRILMRLSKDDFNILMDGLNSASKLNPSDDGGAGEVARAYLSRIDKDAWAEGYGTECERFYMFATSDEIYEMWFMVGYYYWASPPVPIDETRFDAFMLDQAKRYLKWMEDREDSDNYKEQKDFIIGYIQEREREL